MGAENSEPQGENLSFHVFRVFEDGIHVQKRVEWAMVQGIAFFGVQFWKMVGSARHKTHQKVQEKQAALLRKTYEHLYKYLDFHQFHC